MVFILEDMFGHRQAVGSLNVIIEYLLSEVIPYECVEVREYCLTAIGLLSDSEYRKAAEVFKHINMELTLNW